MNANRKTGNDMVCPGLDPRGGTRCGQCLGNKMTSYVLGYLLAVLWILGFVRLLSDPGVGRTAEIVVGVVAGILMLAFSIVLLIGLHKDRRSYIKAYLIFDAVITLILIIGFLVNLFSSPSSISFEGFISDVILITLNTLSFLSVRAFYLATYS